MTIGIRMNSCVTIAATTPQITLDMTMAPGVVLTPDCSIRGAQARAGAGPSEKLVDAGQRTAPCCITSF